MSSRTIVGPVVWILMNTSFPASADAGAATTIPLCPGLQIVTAVSQPAGDYESIKTIRTVSDTEVTLHYSAETRNSDIFATAVTLTKLDLDRTMRRKDLQSATDYQQFYLDKSDERIPGTTSIGTSALVLQNLKTKGKTPFGYSNAYAGLVLSADPKKYPNYSSYIQRGTLARVAGSTTLPVIVNDVPVDLPIVRAEGTFFGDKVEFSFLDDPANPLTLAYRLGIDAIRPLTAEQVEYCAALVKSGATPPGAAHCDKPKGGDRDALRVTKIAFQCPAAPSAGNAAPVDGGSALEMALARQQKADLYSLYFTYDSDAIRDESTPTLAQIGDIMTRHPDWKLAVNGHTDGIGGDQYNVDLSKRRAAAVVTALVTRYHIDAGRLRSAGFGKSQPKDTNDTLEGRARNRRVELMRF